MERKLITKNDIILILLIGLITASFFIFKSFSDKDLIARIYFDGKLVESVNLSEKEEKRILTGENSSIVIVAENGKIFFEKSSCPDGVCTDSGELYRNGDFAACLPEKVIIKVSGVKDKSPDAIVY